jgi:BolA family transcriptional regulator, general stress-responsive regulator
MDLGAEIRERLAALEPRSLELLDESGRHVGHAGYRAGESTHFRMTIVSEHFRGLSRIERHRRVYEALGPLMRDRIHALALTAIAPDEL